MRRFLEIIFSLIIFIRVISSRIIYGRIIFTRIIYNPLISIHETPSLGGRPWAAKGALEGGGRGRARAGRGYAESP
jgi:hypothetical protein